MEDKKTKKPSRYYNFSLITYLTKSQIEDILISKDKYIRSYVYILHNKDLDKEPHFHILIRVLHNTTLSAVKKWFSGYVDYSGNLVNTFVQPMHDITGAFSYLTHNTEECIKQGKYLYSELDLISNNIELWHNTEELFKDNISLALSDLLGGQPLCEVALKYGRDFIIHYHSIKVLLDDIMKGENYGK